MSALPDDIDSKIYERILLLHVRALAAVYGDRPRIDEDDLLDYLLNRERRFWAGRLASGGLDATLLVAVEQAMATITCTGGAKSAQDGLELLDFLPSLKGRPADVRIALNRLLSECYPGNQWIEPIEPDLLGERLCEVAFEDSRSLLNAVLAEVRKAARKKHGNS